MNRTVLWTVVIAAALLLSMTVVASSAFTTVSLDRQTSIDVVSDESGIIALQAHPESDVVNGTDDGALRIDFDQADTGAGVNVNSTYTVGSTSTPTSTYAFNITNQNTGPIDATIDYTLDNAAAGSNVQFSLYDSAGTLVGTAEPGSPTTQSLAQGETLYVVIEVTGGADSNDDLSGTLSISV